MFQIAMDCSSAHRMTQFWAIALGYEVEPPSDGFATWNDYWRSIGVGEDELDQEGDGSDSLTDPAGRGPRIWFQEVPETKTGKNRLHFDLGVSGGRGVPLDRRRARVDAEADRLVAAGATRTQEVPTEGNEFDVH